MQATLLVPDKINAAKRFRDPAVGLQLHLDTSVAIHLRIRYATVLACLRSPCAAIALHNQVREA